MTQQISIDELVKLCAVDTELFGRTFFPRAFRDESPSFAPRFWSTLENPNNRLVNLELFRGAAKTTRLRVFTAKRIAYSISRTILFIGPSEGSALRSLRWIRRSIEPLMGADGVARPSLFAQVFGLRPGKKWQDHELEIIHGVDDRPIWLLGVGIAGGIRGINFDDYRPDLIVCDDLMTDENAMTEDQSRKIVDLVTGAVANSLAPPSEEPNAKLAHLCTPLNAWDVSSHAKQSSSWHSESFGCWTEETKDRPVDEQISAWPSRYPTEELRKSKKNAILDGKYSIFAKEMECKLVAAEHLAFRPNWLRKRPDDWVPARGMQCVLAVDPVPPPSEAQLAKGLRGKDYEVVAVVGRAAGEYHLLDYRTTQNAEPNWTMTQIFDLAARFRVMKIVIESVAYQRVLKWLLEKEMQRRGVYYAVVVPKDKRPKYNRILSTLSGPASQGHLWCSPLHTDFILQFESYGLGYRGHDDLIDAVSMGVAELTNPYLELGAGDYSADDVETFPFRRACP